MENEGKAVPSGLQITWVIVYNNVYLNLVITKAIKIFIYIKQVGQILPILLKKYVDNNSKEIIHSFYSFSGK